MEHHHFHWLEKLQVQIITIAGLLAVYFLAWPVVRPADPLSPMTFLPLAGYGSTVNFAAVFCMLVAICAVVTVAVRPVGALLAATLAAGGVSLRSPQIRSLLWTRQGDMAAMYGELMLEAALLAVLAAAAALIVVLVRRMMAAIRPNWLWKDPLAEQQHARIDNAPAGRSKASRADRLAAMRYLRLLTADAREHGGRTGGRREPVRIRLGRCLACVLMASAIAIVMLAVIMRSTDRGQIIFALLASFTVGVFFAHQVFPQPYALTVWILPMVIAVGVYAAASTGATSSQVGGWARVSTLYRALPVDWLTAGGGGALLGFWVSQRVHEFRCMHHHYE